MQSLSNANLLAFSTPVMTFLEIHVDTTPLFPLDFERPWNKASGYFHVPLSSRRPEADLASGQSAACPSSLVFENCLSIALWDLEKIARRP